MSRRHSLKPEPNVLFRAATSKTGITFLAVAVALILILGLVRSC